jgi:signal transduction histidine kinase
VSEDAKREGSVFWRVAAILIGAQLVTGLFAAGLTAWFASDRQRELAASSLESRMDAVAEEIERRGAPLDGGPGALPDRLMDDLAWRFPDPLVLLDPDGTVVTVIPPAEGGEGAAADGVSATEDVSVNVPSILSTEDDGAAAETMIVDPTDALVAGGFAYAPLYDAAGFPVGGILVQPLRRSIDRELAGTRSAVRRARTVIVFVSILTALALGALLTWLIIRPLRRMSARMRDIAEGRYDARVRWTSRDEFGRLADTINEMAERVEESIENMRAGDRLRRELIANVGHDLRTPLAVLSASVEEAERYLQDGRAERAQALLSTATRQATLLARLVDDLFELTVLEQERPPLKIEPVLPGELLSHARADHEEMFRGADVELIVAPEGGLGPVPADGARLLRVVNNLLTNARRHTPAGGRVELSARREEGDLVISVEDTGSGIPAGDLEHVFERYYRSGDARTRSEESGTGLGLAIARAIAEAHGGTIEARSGEGEGTTVTLRLTGAYKQT